VLLAALFLVGCGPAGEDAGSAAGDRVFLSIGTAPQGGAFYPVGGAIAEVLNRHGGDRGWQVTAEATKGSQENIRRLKRAELDLALANAAITYFAVRGESGWDQVYPLRAVMTLAPNVALFVTPADSGLKTLGDLRDRRVVVGPAGAGFEFFVGPLLEAHGLTYDDFTLLNNTQFGAVDMLSDGSAAAAFLGGAVPTASITQASTSRDIHFIPYGQSEIERLVTEYPFFGRATIPAGTYRNQDADFRGLDVGSMHLITSADKDEELIYQLTKALYENREEVAQSHRAGRAINPTNVVRDTGTPFHPGAVRYYREIGIWPAASPE
jgi:TRAP transporter TAXI family solute receptor